MLAASWIGLSAADAARAPAQAPSRIARLNLNIHYQWRVWSLYAHGA
jgi:hypothetical protein